MKNQKEIKRLFELHPHCEAIYTTHDGTNFFQEHDANNHASRNPAAKGAIEKTLRAEGLAWTETPATEKVKTNPDSIADDEHKETEGDEHKEE